jgi:hypothetical protein
MKMMFSVVVVFIKVVGNLMILTVLKFHDFRPKDLNVMNFTNFYQVLLVCWTDLKGCAF